jgi:DNA invertase Pin-like site-specific DNA recombinase
MKVLGYGRISDANDDEETSLTNQRDEITEEVTELDAEFVEWYQDRNVSGSMDPFTRDGFSELVEHLQEDPDIDLVLIRRGDRLWRDGKTDEVVRRLEYEYDVDIKFYEVEPSALTQLQQEMDDSGELAAVRELIGDLETFIERMEIERAREKAVKLIQRKKARGEPYHRPPRGITTDKQKNGHDTATEWVPVEDAEESYNEFETCIAMLNEMATTEKSPYEVGQEFGVPYPDRKLKNLWSKRDEYRIVAQAHRPGLELRF